MTLIALVCGDGRQLVSICIVLKMLIDYARHVVALVVRHATVEVCLLKQKTKANCRPSFCKGVPSQRRASPSFILMDISVRPRQLDVVADAVIVVRTLNLEL